MSAYKEGIEEPVQKNMVDNTSADSEVTPLTFWQRLTGSGNGFRLSTPAKIGLYLGGFAILMVIVIVLYQVIPAGEDPGAAIDYPKNWTYGWDVIKFIDNVVEWIVIKGDALFSAINIIILRGVLLPLEDFFLWLPWWSIIVITGVAAWRSAGVKVSAMVVVFLTIMSVMGMLDRGSETLAITLTSTVICILFGLPLGILTARSDRLEGIIRPILDMMQTMPSFVYLIPALMLFGLGSVPAVMATCIYAIPPIIRLTNLGIRQVDAQVVEASRSFGTTAWQLLTKVQMPMALPTILAGMNQTIMMALAMVVLASMIGAGGLGAEILLGISRLEVGRGVVAGVSIVFMAITLDRITQGFAGRPDAKRAT